MTTTANQLLTQFENLSATEILNHISNQFGTDAVFSTSFSKEDQVITHLIATNNLSIGLFTLDTGRLFEATYSTWDLTVAKYKINIDTYCPDAHSLQNFINQNGPNSFYESITNRKQCCQIRKVMPLQKAIANKKIWITGIRAAHSSNRRMQPIVEYDATNQIIKIHPLLHWTSTAVNQFIAAHHIPTNQLYEQGFASIGCAPCTRAIAANEDIRAGRWWWEQSKKECGLHTH